MQLLQNISRILNLESGDINNLICGWAAKRYGVDLLDKEGIAWKRKYPKVAAKIDDLESRITKLEKRRK